MSFPTAPPISHTVPQWSMPDFVERRLDWGLRIIVARVGHLPMNHARFLFRRGRVLESSEKLGCARLLTALVRHGTARHSSAEFARALDQLGIRLRVSVGLDSSSFSVTTLSEHRVRALELLDDVVRHPTVPEHFLEKERRKALDVHRHECNDPGFLSGSWMNRILYPEHSYGRPAASGMGLGSITRQDILDLHRSIVRPARGLLMVLGDLDPDRTLDELSERYREPFGESDPMATVPMTSDHPSPRRVAIERSESEQVRLSIGYPLFHRGHDDYYPVTLMNRILGAGASSRLFMILREQESLTYGAYSSLDLGRYGGDLIASLDCSPDKAVRALHGLDRELRRIRNEAIPERELEQARRTLTGSFPNRALGLGGLAGLLSTQWSHALSEDVWVRHLERLSEVSISDVETVARRWLDPDSRSVVMVGPSSALDEVSAGLADVERFDARAFVETPC